MADVTYAARDRQGGVQTGHLEAIDEDQLVAMLQHRGLLVSSISRRDLSASPARPLSGRRPPKARRMHQRVTVDDQVLLCQQLATLVDAGVPLLKSLHVVSSQVESQKLLLALDEVRHDVEAGKTFRDALIKHPGIFSNLWLNLIETGEASGHLAQSLRQLARHYESQRHLQSQAKTALTYPMFLIVVATLVIAIFVYWLIPRFTTMFASMKMELPAITRFVIAVSDAARKYVVAIIFGVVAGASLLRRYLRTQAGQWMRDRLLLRLPLFSGLFTYLQLAEFSRGLATLLESGVPLLSSLEILEKSATNKLYARAIGEIREAVKEGRTMAEPMEATGMFPPMAIQMVQVGEEVGELAKMSSRVAVYFEERVEIFIARMTRLFEPIAILIMAGIVLVIVLSIFMPIFKMAGGTMN
jgi:type IV pilus assembly protein PilC